MHLAYSSSHCDYASAWLTCRWTASPA